MNNIICHIVGINNFIKEDFIKNINKLANPMDKHNNIIVKDLDTITNDIRNTKEMIDLNNSLNCTQKNSNNHMNITKKIQDLWKTLFMEKVDNIIKRNNQQKIIFIGLSTFHKNHKLKININTKNKFFLNLDPKKNAQNVVQYNLEKYKKFIINGSFPIRYIDYQFLVDQRIHLIDIYKNLGFKLKSLDNIYKWLKIYISQYSDQEINSTNINAIIGNTNKLFIGSQNDYNNIIKLTRNIPYRKYNNDAILSKLFGTDKIIETEIFGFTEKWLALIQSIKNINKYIKKGITQIGNKNYPTLKEKFTNAFDILNTFCYIYITSNEQFDKVNNYKYKTTQSVNIQHKEYIKNIYNELVKNGVKMVKK